VVLFATPLILPTFFSGINLLTVFYRDPFFVIVVPVGNNLAHAFQFSKMDLVDFAGFDTYIASDKCA
jgi:ABC-type sulfate transport system permease component